jgi:uncharacterized glyoxalase superfamily protein PhnB
MKIEIRKTHFLLYVTDQIAATEFYRTLLQRAPVLFVPGMTEFELSEHCVLGLMPRAGIKALLGDTIFVSDNQDGLAHCELYFYVSDLEEAFEHVSQCKARLLSPPQLRNWGDNAFYCCDADGHVIAFATRADA